MTRRLAATALPLRVPACAVLAAAVLLDLSGCARFDDAATTEESLTAESSTQLTSARRVHDRIAARRTGAALEVTIIADGRGSERQIGVHASIDGGPWRDYEAALVRGRSDATDVWAAAVPFTESADHIDYVVWAAADGDRLWDDADGAGYRAAIRRPVRWAGQRVVGDALVIELDVENRAYRKSCTAVYTTDDWQRSQYASSSRHVGPTGRAGIERWEVRIDGASSVPPLATAAAVDYAVTCSFGDADERWWDNNLGRNFRHEVATPPVVAWSTPFAAPIDVEIAADGTVFALSTDDPPAGSAPGSRRWISIYDTDGAWRTVVTLPADAEHITYLASQDLLLASLWTADPAQVRRVAIDRSGAIAWDQIGARGPLVLTSSAAFVVSPREVEWITPTAQRARPCVDATVSASGLAACVVDGGVAVIDARTGRSLAALPAGEPYAMSDAGDLVVLATATTPGGTLDTLTGYQLDGTIAWRHTDLALPPDHGFGAPRVAGDCTSHAFADVLGYVDQPASDAAVVLADVRTGAPLRRLAIPGGVLQACPGEDGRFYWSPSYMRYGRWTSVLGVDDPMLPEGVPAPAIDIGIAGTISALAGDGRVAYVHQPYLAPSGDTPQPTVVISDRGHQRYVDHLPVAAGGARPLVDAAGARAVIAADGELRRLDL